MIAVKHTCLTMSRNYFSNIAVKEIGQMRDKKSSLGYLFNFALTSAAHEKEFVLDSPFESCSYFFLFSVMRSEAEKLQA